MKFGRRQEFKQKKTAQRVAKAQLDLEAAKVKQASLEKRSRPGREIGMREVAVSTGHSPLPLLD